MSWLRWLPFRKKTAASSATRPEDAFAARYHRFKLFLGAWGINRRSVEDVAHGVHAYAVDTHFVMEVGAGRTA